jgi:hypothetical protein
MGSLERTTATSDQVNRITAKSHSTAQLNFPAPALAIGLGSMASRNKSGRGAGGASAR